MNNNRGNNRRRGRGNNRPQGGGQQLNRIDSRARGNAPQLLEKYRKLAQDAHLNGDRVQAEYYLQFADHYFRVIADTRQRQEEQRARPNGERWPDQEQDGEDSGDFDMPGDFPNFDRQPQQPQFNRPREDRDDRGERMDRTERGDRGDREPRSDREPRGQREPRRFDRERNRDNAQPESAPVEFTPGVEGEPISDLAADNPFVRDNRAASGLRPRGERRPRGPRSDDREPETEQSVGLDPSSLPPAFGPRSDDVADEAPAAEAPAPKKRGRPRKNPLPEAGPAEAVNG